jgi:D-threo-aldose 1-dehydrogenase
MKQRHLGDTNLYLTELSFGGAGLGNLYRAVSQTDAMATLAAAWSAGMRYFDTAPHYGQGLSERRIGDFLQGKPRGDFILSTKVGRMLKPITDGTTPNNGFVDALPFSIRYDYSYEGIMRSWEDSLARLGLPSIDILFVHDLESGGFTDSVYKSHLETFLTSGIHALQYLKSAGHIGAFGLGVNEVSACLNVMEHAKLDCLLMAGRYSMLDRGATDKLIGLCEKSGTAMIVGGVFNSGILATGAKPGATFGYTEASADIMARVGQMEAVAQKHGVSLATAAMHFPLQNPVVASVLIGTAKPSSVTRNIEMFANEVPDALWPEMDKIALHP